MNQLFYDFAVWLDGTEWSTRIHESFYLYNWIETTHVLTLMLSLGLLAVIDLRMLGWALPNVPAARVAQKLQWPMLIGFAVMIVTGILLFYAIPVRSAQSVWLRLKFILLIAAAVNALLFHRNLAALGDAFTEVPRALRIGAGLSLAFWAGIVTFGRLIAYDWFDCINEPGGFLGTFAGCIPGQEHF